MTIRAVDIVTITPRLQEAGRVQHQHEVQNLAGFQFQNALQQVRAEKAQSQVVETPSSGDVAVQKDGGGQKGSGKQSPGQQEKAKVQQHPEQPGEAHLLDVKV